MTETAAVEVGRLAVERDELQHHLALSRSDTEIAELRKCLDSASGLWADLQRGGTGPLSAEPGAQPLSEALAGASSWLGLLQKNIDVLSGRRAAEEDGSVGGRPSSDGAEGGSAGGDGASAPPGDAASDLAWGRPRTRKPPEPEEGYVGPEEEFSDGATGATPAAVAGKAVAAPAPAEAPPRDQAAPLVSDEDEEEEEEDLAAQDGAVRTSDLEMVDYLGKGAVGKVYLVRQLSTGKLFAVKALSKRAMLQKKKGVAHVMQELNILRSCAHPFVIKLDASFQTKHWLCHMMEFCPRGHFYSLLQAQDKKRLPEDSARFYAAEILSGIEYLHINGFIYRDMKPENILVAESGHLRLTDFDLSQTADELSTPITADDNGIGVSQKEHDRLMELSEKHDSRAKDAAAQEAAENEKEEEKAKGNGEKDKRTAAVSDSTAQGSGGGRTEKESSAARAAPEVQSGMAPARFDSFVGTIEYMAPEVVRGTGHSFAVDFWVFGVMVYEMLYGVTPFRGQDAKATFEDILEKQIRSANFFKHPLCAEPKPKVSSAVRDLIGKLLAKDEKKRLGYAHGVAQIKAHAWFKDVKWDLQRNQEPPVMPEAKIVSLANPKKLEEVFDKLDKEEKEKIQAAAEKRAARRAEKGDDSGGSPEVDRSGANNPARLRGFRYEREPVLGADSAVGAYGNDQTGRKKLIESMAAEAQRRADAQRFTVTISLPLPAALDEDRVVPSDGAAASGAVTIAGIVFEGSESPVVVDVVSGSAAAAEPRLQNARAGAGSVRLVRVNAGVVDGGSWLGCLRRAVTASAEQQTQLQLQFEADECDDLGAGASSKLAAGADSRTSIAWNSGSMQDAATERDVGGGGSEITLEATVPEGVQPGQQILVLAPSGQRIEVTVPEAAEPGSVLRVVVPPASAPDSAARSATCDTPDLEDGGGIGNGTEEESSFAEALAALQAGDYSSAVAHFETVLTQEECEAGRHDEARQGLEQARRGVTLSGLGNEQLQEILDGDGCHAAVHEHLGLAAVDADATADGEASGTGGGDGAAAQPRSPAPAAGLRSWLPAARKSRRKTDDGA